MKKEILLVTILGVVIIVLLVVLIFLPRPEKPVDNKIIGIEGLEIYGLKANQEIASSLKITGRVTGNGWAGFEGQVGTVRLMNSSGEQLALGILTATTDWMTFPVSFETTLNFQSLQGQSGILVFRNENPSDMRDKNREFILPIKITKSSGGFMIIKVYFNNNNLDPEISCNKVFAVEREVPKTTAVARTALEELFKGPTTKEQALGFFTSINEGVKIQSLVIENGTAKVDFDEQLQYQVGGSCRVSAIRAQIEQTLKQFPTVKNVIISINGRTEDILQP